MREGHKKKKKTHVCGVNSERQDVGAREGLDCGLIFRSIADDEDDEPSPLHVQSQGLGQR
jgi:hypothetical protein